ncbi:hypothetical protein M878_41130 [Streptomyces roseochromogenus subsp. oscitans DS 12.976]|uniref:Uncharacterized protein n=1 Tax=Streptomyces roseochromogenus subsp. oscitans DS 12.976 TaxID=1352936 RepID=V6JJ43_STRRC|nr:hypothetical protein M878_41130 [Streptomyces roseochromogenus subsp. oscitans DS 12.976]
MSTRSCTGVSERRYAGTPDGWTPATEAKAFSLPGSVWKNLICFSTSQAGALWVPP